jgi:hypothetical protein
MLKFEENKSSRCRPTLEVTSSTLTRHFTIAIQSACNSPVLPTESGWPTSCPKVLS